MYYIYGIEKQVEKINVMINTTKGILIIDDSNTNVVLLEAVFSSKGYKITTALTVKEAYAVIDKESPSIILLDLNMPVISGFDFLKKIKSYEETKTIPVIIVSAMIDEETIDKTMRMGASAFIKKPVDLPLLKQTVSEILDSK